MGSEMCIRDRFPPIGSVCVIVPNSVEFEDICISVFVILIDTSVLHMRSTSHISLIDCGFMMTATSSSSSGISN